MQNEEQKKSHKGLIVGIVAVVVVVVAVVAVVLGMTMGKGASAESVEACKLQVTALSAHQEAFKAAQESADEAAKIKDVDADLVSALEAAQAEADELGSAPVCPADGSQQEVDEATGAVRTYGESLRAVTSELDAAAKAILATVEEE